MLTRGWPARNSASARPLMLCWGHPQRQRLGAAQHQPRVERAEDCPRRILHESQPLDVVVSRRDDDAADAVAVAVQVLGGAVRDEVGAKGDRLLNVRAGEGVVDHQAGVVAMGEGGGQRQVGQPHHRVARGLDEEHPRLRRERPLGGVEVAGVDVGEAHVVTAQDLVEQPEGAAVDVVRHHRVIAALQQRSDGIDGGHARCEREARLAVFNRREIAFERGAGRILGARVLEPFVPAKLLLHVGGGLINRRDDRAGGRVRFLTGMQANGLEPRVRFQFHDPSRSVSE